MKKISNGRSAGYRNKSTKLKTAKKRKLSSNLWLSRHLNDPYVAKAKLEGYRSRAAYKLLEINAKFKILQKDSKVIDLGAAPGGWSQVAAKIVGPGGSIIAVDLLPMEEILGVNFIQKDFHDEDAAEVIMGLIDNAHIVNSKKLEQQCHPRISVLVSKVKDFEFIHNLTSHPELTGHPELVSGSHETYMQPRSYLTFGKILKQVQDDYGHFANLKPLTSDSHTSSLDATEPDRVIDVVLSDMAPNTTGHGKTDHLRIIDLCTKSLDFALKVLKPGGHFVAKIFKGGAESHLLNKLKLNFKTVKHFKPLSSYQNSGELYIVAVERR